MYYSMRVCSSFSVLSDRKSDLLSLTSLAEEHTHMRRYHTYRIPNTLTRVTSPVSDMLHQTHSSLFLIKVTLLCSLSSCSEDVSWIGCNSISFLGSHQVMSLPLILLASQNPLNSWTAILLQVGACLFVGNTKWVSMCKGDWKLTEASNRANRVFILICVL